MPRMFSSLWRLAQRGFKWVEHAHTWVWIASLFTWPAALISAAVGLGAGIWAFFTGTYGPYAFVVALVVAVLVLILVKHAPSRVQPETPLTPPVEPIFDGLNIAEGKSVRMPARELVYFVANKLGMADAFGGVDVLLEHPARYIEVAFQRAAQNSGIEVIGRKNGVGEHVLIPSTFWYSSTIDQTSFIDTNGKTHPAASERGGVPIAENVPIYTDLWFKRDDVYKAWR